MPGRAAVASLDHATEQPTPEPAPADKRAWRAWADAVARARPMHTRKLHAQTLMREVVQLATLMHAQVVGVYSPIGAEVDTRDLAHALLVYGMEVAYPRVLPDGSAMDFVRADGPSSLQPRPRSRLMEPVGPALDPHALDLLVVPSQAVRGDGRRLGHGGGYFDKYLPLLSPRTVTVAVTPAACVIGWQPVEAHDMALQLVCTEAGLLTLG